MKRRKNLERAVVLGLLLSTSVYGSAWAKFSTQLWINTDEGTGSEFTLSYPERNYEISGESTQNSFDSGVLVTSTNPNTNINYDFTFNWKLNSLNIDITKLAEVSTSVDTNYYIAGVMVDGFDDEKTANLILTTNEDINVKVDSQNNYAAVGVWAQSDDSIKLNSKNGDVTVNVTKTAGSNLSYKDGGEEDRTLHAVYGLNASNDRNAASYDPNDESNGSEINITTDNGSISVTAKNESKDLTGSHVYAAANDNGHLILSAGQGADYTGTGSISLIAESNGNNNVYGLDTWGGEENRLTADEIHLSAKAESGEAYGLKVSGGADENKFTADRNEIIGESESGKAYGIWADDDSRVDISGRDNFISGTVTENPKNGTGIMVDDSVVFIEGNNNYINAAVDSDGNVVYLGKAEGLAVDANNASSVVVKGNASNAFGGAVYANGLGTSVIIEGKDIPVTNNFYSAAIIEGAGDLDKSEDETMKNLKVISSLYAQGGAEINLSGKNTILTYADKGDNTTAERSVWAYDKGKINVDGYTYISTNEYDKSPNSMDVAVAAGTATNLNKDSFDNYPVKDEELAKVNINYANDGNSMSYINGDILAAYAGEVNINPLGENSKAVNNAGIAIKGNLLAGNNGVLDVNLGKGGVLIGRADDYGDAGAVENSGHGTVENEKGETFYNPAFSSDIYKGGDITLTMGDGSQWNVQGQSWITNVNTNGNVTIDLTNVAEEYQGYKSHALTIRNLNVNNLNGSANIKMNLNGDRSQSDMLYIGQGKGEYNIELAELVKVSDMYAQSDDKSFNFSGLRFATVGAGSDVKFNVTAKDQGFNNVIYTVDTDVYNSAESAHENNAYNGENMTEEKPGNSLVDDLLNGKQNASTESGIATLAANDVMLLADENDTENDNKTQHLNYKLVDMQSDGPTDAGKTMLNMSRANYSNAIYMDRLNKRLGEARYINDDPEEDEGMWVRIRHDRIGKEDAFRSQNTMYELGYDVKQECDNGERRVGFAVDYMHGDTGYSDVAGKGELDRYGLWLYDTWMGDKGHYVDYVAKWGHLDNDFEVYTMSEGKKVTGDYSNNVFSVSAEYGRKKDIGNDWYFEPQAQLQLARVTGADYTTNQGTKVSVDGINSLIGRAGFRIGKDFGEEKQSTLYFKADVLHEFLGDQDVSVMDGTTNGTWAGISGYAAMMSKSSYAFIDLEQSFGNDNDDTYQINAGVRWTF